MKKKILASLVISIAILLVFLYFSNRTSEDYYLQKMNKTLDREVESDELILTTSNKTKYFLHLDRESGWISLFVFEDKEQLYVANTMYENLELGPNQVEWYYIESKTDRPGSIIWGFLPDESSSIEVNGTIQKSEIIKLDNGMNVFIVKLNDKLPLPITVKLR